MDIDTTPSSMSCQTDYCPSFYVLNRFFVPKVPVYIGGGFLAGVLVTMVVGKAFKKKARKHGKKKHGKRRK